MILSWDRCMYDVNSMCDEVMWCWNIHPLSRGYKIIFDIIILYTLSYFILLLIIYQKVDGPILKIRNFIHQHKSCRYYSRASYKSMHLLQLICNLYYIKYNITHHHASHIKILHPYDTFSLLVYTRRYICTVNAKHHHTTWKLFCPREAHLGILYKCFRGAA